MNAETGRDLDAVADELYGLRPGEFVPARNAREKDARSRGDRELAARIRLLGKPSAAAWLANQLVRQRPDEVRGLLDLGEQLREATAVLSGDELRRLSAQQQRVLNALVGEAKRVATDAGEHVSDSTARALEDTLRAALADPDLADELASGRLTTALQHVGFGSGLGDIRPRALRPESERGASRLGPARGRRVTTGRDDGDRRAEKLERARQELGEAQAAAEEASAELEHATAALGEAGAREGQLAEDVKLLRAELERTAGEHEEARRAARDAEARHRKAERAAEQARRRLDNAGSNLHKVEQSGPSTR